MNLEAKSCKAKKKEKENEKEEENRGVGRSWGHDGGGLGRATIKKKGT